jgi:hypothetical protein
LLIDENHDQRPVDKAKYDSCGKTDIGRESMNFAFSNMLFQAGVVVRERMQEPQIAVTITSMTVIFMKVGRVLHHVTTHLI